MIEIIKDAAEHIPLKGGKSYTASQMLERFLFPGHMHYVLVKKLSGGEKRRLSLIRTLMLNPNFLILDEHRQTICFSHNHRGLQSAMASASGETRVKD